MAHADRLSALDALFLALEDANDPLHVAMTMIFERAPLCRPDGALDHEALRAHLGASVGALPRMHQRIGRVPLLGHPVWLDDEHFDVTHHVRTIALPPPGNEAALREVVATFHAQPIDRARPLWELLVIDGLEGDRLALTLKVHHAVVDGVAGIGALAHLFGDAARDPDVTRRVRGFGPSRERLLVDEISYRLLAPWRALRRTGRKSSLRSRALDAVRGLAAAGWIVAHPAPRTSINPSHPGTRRVFGWTSFDLERVRAIGHAAGGTLNDAALAIIAMALHQWLQTRGDEVSQLALRVMLPVSLHPPGEIAGNKVSLLLADLPTDAPDARECLARVVKATRHAKSSHQSQGIAWGEALADWTTPSLLSAMVRASRLLRPYNLIVTNIPGPDVPLSLYGARMIAAYPMVPLYGNQALGIALSGYAGRLFIAVNGDRDTVPDLDAFVTALDEAAVSLRETWLDDHGINGETSI